MRCKTCDYPLWNLKGRQCPECGTAFLPSEFDFVLNSVQFCCPHCEQAYYGTTERGHLVPSTFTCVKCNLPISMDSMVLRPATGVREEQTQVNRMPWFERKQRGWIKAWLCTVRDSMVRPSALILSVPPETGLGPAWGYALLTTVILMMVGVGLPMATISCVMALSGSRDALGPLGTAFIQVPGGILAMLLTAAVWAATAHGILRVSGKTAGTIGRTYECFLYSIGTMAPIAVPCIGPFCGSWFMWLWWLVAATIMLMIKQQVSGLRATIATAVLPVVLGVLAAVGYVVLIFAMVGTTGGFATATANSEVATITTRLKAHAVLNNGSGPGHAVELIGPGFGATSFTSPSTATDPSKIKIAQTTLDQFDFLPDNRLTIAQQAAATQPSNVIAHRCGDFVFTYHGIDLNSCDPGLWTVIFSPDPDFTTLQSWAPPAVVGRADGTIRVIGPVFQSALDAQNQLRAQYNLAPLPLPETVTHAIPAVTNKPNTVDSPP